MIKFDLERALRGDELITRNGASVTHFRLIKNTEQYPYRTDDCTYTTDGLWWDGEEWGDDLFMKYEDKKTMDTFTKSDLKTGMFVKYRHGNYKLVLGSSLTDVHTFNLLGYYVDSLLHKSDSSFDILSVYTTCMEGRLGGYLEGKNLVLLWERTQQTEAQKEMEALNKKIAELQEQATRLQGKL